jgi:hypothetical protein
MNLTTVLTPDQQFEVDAKPIMEQHYGVVLRKRKVAVAPGLEVKFDYVADLDRIVGDAKFYKMRRGPDGKPKEPNGKLATISQYVGFLQQVPDAGHRFLVFGNEAAVPLLWLKRFASTAAGVDFFFMENGQLTDLKKPAAANPAD